MSWPTIEALHLVDAMIHAEGGTEAFVRAVRCSVPGCVDIQEARRIALNTIAHAAFDSVPLGHLVTFLGGRWAPVGATNDPTSLNKNWIPNVLDYLEKHPL